LNKTPSQAHTIINKLFPVNKLFSPRALQHIFSLGLQVGDFVIWWGGKKETRHPADEQAPHQVTGLAVEVAPCQFIRVNQRMGNSEYGVRTASLCLGGS